MLFLADLVISAIKLAEAEVKAFRRGMFRVFLALAALLAAMAFLVAGLSIIVLGFFLLLEPAAGPVGASFLVGLITLLIAGILVLLARAWTR